MKAQPKQPRYYFYKMVADNGGAPCVQGKLLSLAICKPQIRSTCKKGDVVFGFAGRTICSASEMKKRYGESLIYIAVVKEVIRGGEYYKTEKYKNRRDCIYKWVEREEGFKIKATNSYHGEGDLKRDIGDKDGSKANVLISKQFKYFGNKAIEKSIWSKHCRALETKITALCSAHRVNHSDEVRDELDKLIKRYLKKPSICGSPIHSSSSSKFIESTIKGSC